MPISYSNVFQKWEFHYLQLRRWWYSHAPFNISPPLPPPPSTSIHTVFPNNIYYIIGTTYTNENENEKEGNFRNTLLHFSVSCFSQFFHTTWNTISFYYFSTIFSVVWMYLWFSVDFFCVFRKLKGKYRKIL